MLTPTSKHLSEIKIDYKRIDLLRIAAQQKSFRVTPDMLKRLEGVDSADLLVCPPSTSTAVASQPPSSPAPSSAVRKNPKRKIEEDIKLTSAADDKCSHCNCKMLRVVDPERPDGKRVLECMRSTCLASIKFTDLPVGTIVGKESLKAKSSYNCLARYYPKSRYTPTPDEQGTDDQEQRRCGMKKDHQMVFESSVRGIFVDVPGQEAKARFLG
ncbi:hypothetical protein GCK72_001210 [Caenorhabditis remanei]|uniref:Uncharacterized protein n=1 Tax=Caenorhabditis remanei TaxID=31234 RepID=A0A6A5HT38_CAERE|nr:hypothetical protein GCK72_001210 [Caenorhabditis remanei]KAF1769393.1 hypothetical protein GCK72_001210 [Caenorhabditis remanei]